MLRNTRSDWSGIWSQHKTMITRIIIVSSFSCLHPFCSRCSYGLFNMVTTFRLPVYTTDDLMWRHPIYTVCMCVWWWWWWWWWWEYRGWKNYCVVGSVTCDKNLSNSKIDNRHTFCSLLSLSFHSHSLQHFTISLFILTLTLLTFRRNYRPRRLSTLFYWQCRYQLPLLPREQVFQPLNRLASSLCRVANGNITLVLYWVTRKPAKQPMRITPICVIVTFDMINPF
jgi:hypothetical protein